METIIKERIKEKGIKIKWLAEQIGIAPRTLSDWISYKNITQVEQFSKLLLILELNTAEVMQEIYEKKD